MKRQSSSDNRKLQKDELSQIASMDIENNSQTQEDFIETDPDPIIPIII